MAGLRSAALEGKELPLKSNPPPEPAGKGRKVKKSKEKEKPAGGGCEGNQRAWRIGHSAKRWGKGELKGSSPLGLLSKL